MGLSHLTELRHRGPTRDRARREVSPAFRGRQVRQRLAVTRQQQTGEAILHHRRLIKAVIRAVTAAEVLIAGRLPAMAADLTAAPQLLMAAQWHRRRPHIAAARTAVQRLPMLEEVPMDDRLHLMAEADLVVAAMSRPAGGSAEVLMDGRLHRTAGADLVAEAMFHPVEDSVEVAPAATLHLEGATAPVAGAALTAGIIKNSRLTHEFVSEDSSAFGQACLRVTLHENGVGNKSTRGKVAGRALLGGNSAFDLRMVARLDSSGVHSQARFSCH